MNRQFIEQQRKLKEEEERVNDLIKKWDFYNSDKSKKFFNFPTMQELQKYEDNFKAYGYEEHRDKLEHDLNYIEFILEKTEKYDFFIPCRLNNHEFYPEEVKDLEISDIYLYKLQSIRKKIKQALEMYFN